MNVTQLFLICFKVCFLKYPTISWQNKNYVKSGRSEQWLRRYNLQGVRGGGGADHRPPLPPPSLPLSTLMAPYLIIALNMANERLNNFDNPYPYLTPTWCQCCTRFNQCNIVCCCSAWAQVEVKILVLRFVGCLIPPLLFQTYFASISFGHIWFQDTQNIPKSEKVDF